MDDIRKLVLFEPRGAVWHNANAATTARLIGQLITGEQLSLGLHSYRINRFSKENNHD